MTVSEPSSLGEGVRLLDRNDSVALTVGLRNPTILLSTGLLRRLSASSIEVVLAHERAHVLRGDTRTALLERIMASLFPKNVATSLLARVALAREQACDAAAARSVGGTLPVARALTEVARSNMREFPMGVSINSSALESRIQYLLEPAGGDLRTAVAGVTLGLVVLVIAGAGPIHLAVERFITFLVH